MKMIFTLGLSLLIVFSSCDFMSHTHCDDKILSQEKSPDGKYMAVLYHRSCANNTGLYTCVNVQEITGSVFSKGEAQPVLALRGIHEISTTWTSANGLEIKSEGFKDQKTVLTRQDAWKTIKISYKD